MAWDFWIYYLLLHFFSFFMLLIITNWNIILCVVVSVKEYHTWNPPFNVLTTLIYAISYWDFCIYFREVEKQKWQDPRQRRLFFLGHWRYDALLCLLSVKSVDHYLLSSVTYQLTIQLWSFWCSLSLEWILIMKDPNPPSYVFLHSTQKRNVEVLLWRR